MSTIRSTLAILASATATVPVPYNYFGKLPKPKQEPTEADYTRIQTAHAKERLIRLAQLDGWGRLYNAGRVADSRQQHGQEAA